MTSRTHYALPLTAVKESCSCCSTPSGLVDINVAGRMLSVEHAHRAAPDETEVSE